METIKNVSISELHSFRNHPFKVETNTELCELMRSIEKEGVLVPLLVRTNPYGDGYEVISGHRRKEAALWAGETEVPVVIRELDDDQAVVAMVDSNLHRENLKPSEKAFAYRMKLEAIENIAFSVARLYHQEKNYRNYFEKMLKVLRKEGSFE